MTPAEIRTIRKRLGLSGPAFARALGYGGAYVAQTMARLERNRGDHSIPPAVAALAMMYDRHGIDPVVAEAAAQLGEARARASREATVANKWGIR